MTSLPNKYRPILFSELVGQDFNQKFFKSLIAQGQISRNIVLAGFFGSSKTTTARIYARALLCEHPTSDGEPCNHCDSCLKSLAGTHPDIMEIDASSKGGKEDIINLVEVAKTPPLFSKRRVIIDDEVQAHSRQAWDALLKLIEEPPPFLTFIFCTTEKEKVRPAILSRCAVRDVNLLTDEQAVNHLKNICNKEGFRYEDSALKVIAQVAQGHPRDLLKNLEQVSFIGDITLENAKTILSDTQVDFAFELLQKFHESELPSIVSSILATSFSVSNLYELLKEILLHFRYNIFGTSRIVFNVLFDTCDQKLFTDIYKSLSQTASLKKITPLEYIDELLKVLSENKPYGKPDMIIRAGFLYNYIHSQSQDSETKGALVSAKTSRRREFVNSYRKNPNPEPVSVDPILTSQPTPIPEPSSNGKVYAHTLIQEGFDICSEDDLEIVNF